MRIGILRLHASGFTLVSAAKLTGLADLYELDGEVRAARVEVQVEAAGHSSWDGSRKVYVPWDSLVSELGDPLCADSEERVLDWLADSAWDNGDVVPFVRAVLNRS